jgi:DNA-binding PadR family transcriptional regulator
MTKREVLEIFHRSSHFVTPDEICIQLREVHHRSSVYSYLYRLHKQGLLLRGRAGWAADRVAYRISPRGIERLSFLHSVHNTGEASRSHT